MSDTLTVALISDVFYDAAAERRLSQRLEEAKSRGAALAILPELPLNPWSPATKKARNEDAEETDGPRTQMQRDAAKHVGIALIGGAIIRDRQGVRRNTALVIDETGKLVGTYCKCAVPEEPGFWETSHYSAGAQPPAVFNHLNVPLGVQICSDINRPEGSHLLGAMGAELIAAPRATEEATYPRWKIVFQANAITSCVFIASVNRPRAEQGVLIGGPSIVVGPDGQVIVDTRDPVALATIDRGAIRRAKVAYPGYLPVRTDLYAAGWLKAANASGDPVRSRT